MPPPSLTVLCVSDADGRRAETVAALEGAGHAVRTAAGTADLDAALDGDVDCVVTGDDVADGDCFDVVGAVRARYPDCPVVVFTDAEPSAISPERNDVVVEYLSRTVPRARERLVDLVEQSAVAGYQVAYPVPEAEAERVAALERYDLAANRAVDAFDRLTALIANHFDITVAFVGLLDQHEERFVACEGANWETLARENSICTYTILEDDVMVVEDVSADPRFASNDRLAELGIRSYAGARLTDAAGHAIGALCCTHDEPRSYSEAELTDLRRFADEAEEQLEFRRRLRAVEGTPADGEDSRGGP